MHVFTLNVRMCLQVKWTCRVSGRYSVGQEWRGWLHVCSRGACRGGVTLSMWAHATPPALRWDLLSQCSPGSDSQSLKSGRPLVAALHEQREAITFFPNKSL